MNTKITTLLVLGALAVGVTGCSSAASAQPAPTAGTADTVKTSTPLQAAARACSYQGIELLDDGTALSFDMEGEDYGSGEGTVHDAACLLNELEVPDSTIAKMDGTRALDGTQSDEFDDYEITWSYHPDDGLDFIIEAIG